MTHVPGTQPTNLANVLRYIFRRPRSAKVILRKLRKRLDGPGRYSARENAAWLDTHRRKSSAYAKERDPIAWKAADAFGKRLEKRAAQILPTVPFDFGAGGDYRFLYWLVRTLKPSVVVETGVSVGWTSAAILEAMDANGFGTLHSSDFPYFRVKNPEQYVGILVEERLKQRWRLHIDGDENALPRIMASVDRVDLFNYDSDKSRSGREFAYQTVAPKLHGPMLMDDVLNDSWFMEFVEGREFEILGDFGMTDLS